VEALAVCAGQITEELPRGLLTRWIVIRIMALARGKKWREVPFPIDDASSGGDR
jgi:hypothetical protein